MKKHLTISLLGAAALLAACGGGGDAPALPAATAEVPAGASASSAGLKDYLVALSALSSSAADDKEPLSLATFTPVRPDDTEPEPVN